MHGGGGMGGGGMRGGGGVRGGGGGGFRGGTGGFRGGNFRGGVGYRGNRLFYGFSPYLYSGFYGYPYFDYWDPFFDSSDYGYGYPPDNGYSPSGYPYVDNSGGGAPAVIINQNSGGYPYGPPAGQAYAPPPPPPAPAIREYTGPATQAQAQQYQAPLYLIAFSDGMIRAVLAYWVDGATLHYVSMDHEQKQAPLSTVDRALSDRLNRERNVTFELPH